MPYRGPSGFPEEYASKIGHISLVQSKFIKSMMPNLRHPEPEEVPHPIIWNEVPSSGDLSRIIAVDGSKSTQTFSKWPFGKYTLLNLAVVDLEWDKLKQSTGYPDPQKYNQQDTQGITRNYIATKNQKRSDRIKRSLVFDRL